MTDKLTEVLPELSKPFPSDRVSWKPQITTKTVNGQKQMIMRDGVRVAGCMAYIDARDVMNRLDEVVGGNWSDYYSVISDKNVECTLTVFGVSRTDVGQIVGAEGTADPMKTIYSDAFKRAAVKFGIGRYLYEEEIQWLPYDGYRVDRSGIQPSVVAEPSQEELTDFAEKARQEYYVQKKNVMATYSSLKSEYEWLTLDHVRSLWQSLEENGGE